MKKALLIVHHYKPEKDKLWGSLATDYATSDMIKNIADLFPDYDWRPATIAEARQILRKFDIDRLLLVPMLKEYAEELDAYPDVHVDCLTPDIYGKISKPPFAFLRKEYLN